jgi:hypothetical protein
MNDLRRITERYLLEKQISASEEGSVFRGTDLQSDATVAVRLIRGDGESEAWRQRFMETARALETLGHPSFPRVLDFGITHAGSAFLVTEYLDGSGWEAATGLKGLEALRALLEAAPRGDPEAPGADATTPTAPPLDQRRLLLGIGVPVAAVLLVGIAFGLVLLRWQSPEPPPPRPQPAAIARSAVPPPPVAAPAVTEARKHRPRAHRPPDARAQRERLAKSLEARADAEIAAGRFDAALDHLKALRRSWPDRAGLAARMDRVAAERKTDEGLADLLSAVGWSETLHQPLEGLRLLNGARPNPRYAQRFQETRRRLETQFVQLDSRPPGLSLGVAGVPLYEKGKAGTVHLRIIDDFGVKTTEAWARTEGGPFVRVALRHLFGSGYSLDVPPEVHRNGTVEFYITASDLSGHSGQLGSAEHPLKMMRQSWLERVLGLSQRSEGQGRARTTAATSSSSAGRTASAAGSIPSRRSSALVTGPIEAARSSSLRRSQSVPKSSTK